MSMYCQLETALEPRDWGQPRTNKTLRRSRSPYLESKRNRPPILGSGSGLRSVSQVSRQRRGPGRRFDADLNRHNDISFRERDKHDRLGWS